MSRKHKAKPVEPAAQPEQDAPQDVPHESPAVVVLRVARLDACRVLCPAGTVIAPNVAGWPDARVNLHLLHGHAELSEPAGAE